LPNKALARARKEENGVVLTRQLTRNVAMTDAEDQQLANYGEEWQDDFGFAPLDFHEEDFQAQFLEHGGKALQNVNITISHSIGVVESIPVKSNCGCVPHDAEDRDTQLRIVARNGKMTVALHRRNLMKKISRHNFRYIAAKFLRMYSHFVQHWCC